MTTGPLTYTDASGRAHTVTTEDRCFYVATNLSTGRYIWDVTPMPELSGYDLTYGDALALFARALPETRRIDCAVEIGLRWGGRQANIWYIMAAGRNGRVLDSEFGRDLVRNSADRLEALAA